MTYQPLNPRQLKALNLPPLEYVIDGIMPAGALIELTSREKSGKSLMLIDALVSVAAGEPFMDRAVRQGPTALIAMEDSLRECRERLYLRLNGLWDIPVHLLPCDGSLPEVRFSLEDSDSLANLAAMIQEYKLIAVGIDPFRETHHQPENDSDSMAPLLRPVRQIAHETNCAILITHHDNRSGTGSRGSTAIAAAYDQICHWKLNDQDGTELSGTLHIKGIFGPRNSIRARFAQFGRWEIDDSSPVPTNTRESIIVFLKSAGDWHNADSIHSEIRGDDVVKLKTVQNSLGELVRTGEVIRHGAGKPGDPFRYAVPGTSRLFPDVPETAREESSPCPETLPSGIGGNTPESGVIRRSAHFADAYEPAAAQHRGHYTRR